MKRKFLSLILAAALTTSLVIMPVVSTSAAEEKSNSILTLYSDTEDYKISNDSLLVNASRVSICTSTHIWSLAFCR